MMATENGSTGVTAAPKPKTNGKTIEYRVEFTLREDAHFGTGSGDLLGIDAVVARDDEGRIVFAHSELKGLIRQAAEELGSLLGDEHKDYGARPRQELLGKGGNSPAGLVCTEFRSLQAAVATKVSTRTGRQCPGEDPATKLLNFGRSPQTGTMHSLELAPTETIISGAIRCDAQHTTLLEACLRRIQAIGRGRARGQGSVGLRYASHVVPRSATFDTTTDDKAAGHATWTLRLQNLAPLLFVERPIAGNVNRTLPHIPGPALRGALLSAMGDIFCELEVGPAYPVATADANGPIVPAPLSFRIEKGKGLEHGVELGSLGEFDQLRAPAIADAAENAPKTEGKRIKAPMYLQWDGALWRWSRSRIQTVMRQQVADYKKENSQLFSEEVLATGQIWQAEIRGPSTYLTALKNALFPPESTKDGAAHHRPIPGAESCSPRPWLRLGRGGRPSQILSFGAHADKPLDIVIDTDSTSAYGDFMLTTPLIARRPWLTFATELDVALLRELLQLTAADNHFADLEIVADESFQDVHPVHGYNRASGLPREPALAIAAGSTFRIRAEGKQTLQDLWRRMSETTPLGERTLEGYGRVTPCPQAHKEYLEEHRSASHEDGEQR